MSAFFCEPHRGPAACGGSCQQCCVQEEGGGQERGDVLGAGSEEVDGEEDSPSRPKGRSQRNSSESEFVMSEGEEG